MKDQQSLKALILLRRQPLVQEVGSISEELCGDLIRYAETHPGDIKNSMDSRESLSSNKDAQRLEYDITEFYDQVYVKDQSLIDRIESECGIEVSSIRIGVLQPKSILDWHIDYETSLRVHADLSHDSEIYFRTNDGEQVLKKKRLALYKLNASWYHKVENQSDSIRYALIGNFVDEVQSA